MIPYPGESLTLRAANEVGGSESDLLDLIQYRDGSATLAAGGEWTAWVSSGWADYLDDDSTPLTVSWVVEVLSGSATVTASEAVTVSRGGVDPTPIGLGSHVLTTGTNVITSTFTATDVLYATNNLMLRLEATSGSAVVQQLKMRAWPTAGVAGGWSDPYPSYDREAAPEVWRLLDTREASGSVADAQAHADEFVSLATVEGEVTGQVSMSVHTTGGVTSAFFRFSASIYKHAAENFLPDVDSTLGIEEGVDYVRPPEEVFGDSAHFIDALGSVAANGWTNTTLQTQVTGAAGGFATFAAILYAGPDSPLEITWPDSTAAPTVSVPDVERFVLASSHSWMVGGSVPSEVEESTLYILGNGLYDFDEAGGPDWVGIRSIVTFPSYRVWSPTVVNGVKHPHLIFWRTDGLGAGAGLVFQRDTRQSSGLVFGNP